MPKRSPVTDDADRDREAVLPADVVSGDSKLPPQVRTWGVRFLILAGLAPPCCGSAPSCTAPSAIRTWPGG